MAPSSPIVEEKLDRGVRYLEKLGYRTEVMPSCYAREHYLAGSAEKRAAELMELINRNDIDAIFFGRGGFGSAAMLPRLDFDAIRKARKLMVGYSDITALEWGIYAKTGLPSLSTGMPATDFCNEPVHPVFEEAFWKFIETGRIDYEINAEARSVIPEVRGICFPGTISVALGLAGTPYEPDLTGAIPVLEDVGESRHKVEGFVWHARLAGWFDKSNAVVFGDFDPPEKETFPDNPDLGTVFERAFEDIDTPYVTGIPYGHIDHKVPFPLGVEITLSADKTVKIASTQSLFDR